MFNQIVQWLKRHIVFSYWGPPSVRVVGEYGFGFTSHLSDRNIIMDEDMENMVDDIKLYRSLSFMLIIWQSRLMVSFYF